MPHGPPFSFLAGYTRPVMRENNMTRHFGVLIPSTNTTVEIECRLVPATYQAHVGRLKSSGGRFSPRRGEDIDYQARLLGAAQGERVSLAQDSGRLLGEGVQRRGTP